MFKLTISVPIPQPTGCVSGCSEGHVVHWDMRSGNCVHDLGEYSVGVVKLESTRETTVGLFAENTVIVWDNFSGETLYTLAMVRNSLLRLRGYYGDDLGVGLG